MKTAARVAAATLISVSTIAAGTFGATAADATPLATHTVSTPSVAQRTATPNRNYYGAIAINTKSLAGAYSYDYSSKSKATSAALKKCKKTKDGKKYCKTALWVRNQCGALYIKKVKGGYKLYAGFSRSKSTALAKAKKAAGKGGHKYGYVCTTR